jgi:hypothetical protein
MPLDVAAEEAIAQQLCRRWAVPVTHIAGVRARADPPAPRLGGRLTAVRSAVISQRADAAAKYLLG